LGEGISEENKKPDNELGEIERRDGVSKRPLNTPDHSSNSDKGGRAVTEGLEIETN